MNGLTCKLFLIAFLVFIITDTIWLGFVAKTFYLESYAPWLRLTAGKLTPLWWPALMVYFLLALSLIVFIVPLANASPYSATLYGAVLGAIIYGVYDFTCLAIFKDFPISTGLVDWLWGMILCAWSAFVTVYLGEFLK